MSTHGTFGAFGVAFLAILTLPDAARSDPSLCLNSHPSNEIVKTYPLDPGGTFALGFIHSVSRTPVVDTYEIAAGQIIQTAEIFKAHGAGLPSTTNEMHATGWRHENGHFILDLERPIGAMIVRVQPEYENTLHINGQSIALASLGHVALRIAACEPSE
ncbi:DUF1850 domain-containing protein [Sulfitobacter sp. SK011]|uniref:DUF1850 domain-containing protein n=1 Tax=Sulfitobacter sp. SK011 TaxID=1389004 RepID=UPI000E0BFC40|nr:DUF1850 domain-containing protein [Sulfitobacter sp. SK011]AXI44037.1 hypothetical protein C1J02_20560 [Sulfitobacter sp. SK011]